MKHSDEPVIYEGVDQIRQVQFLLVLCALLPPNGTLRQGLTKALALHEEPLLARMSHVPDLHPFATLKWLDSFWSSGSLPEGERDLVEWQNISDNMHACMRELAHFEEQTGVRLIPEKVS